MENSNISVSPSTVHRHLLRHNYVYRKSDQCIQLSDLHKEKRVNCARTWISENLNWDKVIFSDEKKFCLDGPDSWMSYRPKGTTIVRQKRQTGGGSVMVWCMSFSSGETFFKTLKGVQKSSNYLGLLSNFAVPIIQRRFGDDFIFQQDNCSIHTSKVIKTFFMDSEIKLLDWPSKSPDLNIVENIWKMLSDIVYDGPQMKNIKDLEEKIIESTNILNNEKKQVIQSLFSNYRRRLCDVLVNLGSMTKH